MEDGDSINYKNIDEKVWMKINDYSTFYDKKKSVMLSASKTDEDYDESVILRHLLLSDGTSSSFDQRHNTGGINRSRSRKEASFGHYSKHSTQKRVPRNLQRSKR